jgi:hypothetical protein
MRKETPPGKGAPLRAGTTTTLSLARGFERLDAITGRVMWCLLAPCARRRAHERRQGSRRRQSA